MVEIDIENIVGTFHIAPSLDLPMLARVLSDATYNPSDLPAVVVTFKKPKAVCMLFSEGKIIITGVKSMAEIDEVIHMLNDRLSVLGIKGEVTPSVSIQNMVASMDYQQSLNLRSIAKAFPNTEYEPLQFPGLVYKTDDPNTVILVFDSGKVVCNGSTSEAILTAMDRMIEQFVSIGIRKEENVCPK